VRSLCPVLVAVILAGCGIPTYRDADAHIIPLEGLGNRLPKSEVAFDESGLDEDSVYVYYIQRQPEVIQKRYGFDRILTLMRFWRGGEVAFKSYELRKDEQFGLTQADDMTKAVVGKYVIVGTNKLVLEDYTAGVNRWKFEVMEGHIAENGDVLLTRQKFRGEEEWTKINIHGKKMKVEGMKYQPTW
jgi:hypothetical protein